MTKKHALARLEYLHDQLNEQWRNSKSKKNRMYLMGKMEGYNDGMFVIENMKYYKKDGFDLSQKTKDNIKKYSKLQLNLWRLTF